MPQMSEQSWPEDGLERVMSCPVCGSPARSLVHDGLSDRVFFTAPGTWSLWRCSGCRSAYLDPRPNAATIGIAYSRYYTHAEPAGAPTRTRFQDLRFRLANGYRNRRYGATLTPALALGGHFARLFPPLGWPLDVAYRFMPRPPQPGVMRVLDIGCGDGHFLELARGAGWQVAGVEPDPVSRSLADKRGIEVRATVAEWLDESASFDFVSISHVIEHVHDPLDLLRNSRALLKSGGTLFIDTPNIDSVGHEIFGRDWRGLEPPRHLVLFNRRGLSDAVERSGFVKARYRTRPNPFADMWRQSCRITAGLDPYSPDPRPADAARPPLRLRLRSAVSRRNAEFLTLTAVKP